MFTLVTDQSKYFRVKRGQSAREVEEALSVPVVGAVFPGRIVETGVLYKLYRATVGESYSSIALKFSVDEQELKTLNGFKPVYPTCRIFVPCK